MVTVTWPNVDGIPYLGNLFELSLSADIFARYLRSKGANLVFIFRIDEQGTPDAALAKGYGLDSINSLFENWGISFDNYNRTYSTDHLENVQDFCQKPSKSYDIQIRIDEALELAPVDYWRYWLIDSSSDLKEGRFSFEDFVISVDYFSVFLGDFIHRTLTFIYKRLSGRVPERVASSDYDEDDIDFIQAIQETPKLVAGLIESFSFKSALKKIFNLVRKGYDYLSRNKPWDKKAQADMRIGTTLNLCIQCVRTLAILLLPYLPNTSQKIWSFLGISEKIERIRWSDASNLAIKSGFKIKKPQKLFPPVYAKEMENRLRTFRKKKKYRNLKNH